MNYENVNLESGHERHHQVTRCLHTEETRRDFPGGAKFTQMVTGKAQPLQDPAQALEGLAADLRNVPGQRRGRFFGGEGISSEGGRNTGASVLSVREDAVRDTSVRTSSVRAEDAASIACFGLEKPLEVRHEAQKEAGVRRVSRSHSSQSGSSYLRQKREALKARIGGNVRKGVRMVRAVLARLTQEKEKPVEKSSPVLETGQEYLLDSYGRDGAYRQMSKSSLLKNNMNEKA